MDNSNILFNSPLVFRFSTSFKRDFNRFQVKQDLRISLNVLSALNPSTDFLIAENDTVTVLQISLFDNLRF